MKKKGFTLIEMLVVVLIVGVLTSIAMSMYFRAVERSRVAEALVLMGKVVESQQRYKLRRGQGYSTNWKALDFAPQGVPEDKTLVPSVIGAENLGFCTKMKDETTCGNGFVIELVGSSSSDDKAGVIATRNGNSNFGRYQLFRYYDDLAFRTYCDAQGLEDSASYDAMAMCTDYVENDVYVKPGCKPGVDDFHTCEKSASGGS